MALTGKAALAMWWDMAAPMKSEFEHWHSHEHFPERLGVPGFRRSSRWISATGGDGVFVLYELDDHAVLSSPGYLSRLNAPTPWSSRLMPHHRNMVRSQSHVLASHGGAIARFVLTVRFSVHRGREPALIGALGASLMRWPGEPGLVGAHLLRHETPAIGQTTEQRMRAAPDEPGDWVLLVMGYELDALEALSRGEADDANLGALGCSSEAIRGIYALSHSATSGDAR